MFDSRVIANTLLDLALADRQALTPMKVQKLVYLAHGWYLALTGKPLAQDAVEAWRYGPVFPMLYTSFRRYGNRPIDTYYKTLDLDAYQEKIPFVDDMKARRIIEQIWQGYGWMSALQLSALTHQSETPWDRTIQSEGERAVIENEVIATHFRQLMEEGYPVG